MDYNNTNISKEVSTIWNVANIIRGVYKHSDFRKVILPMTIIRRMDCALAPYKEDFLSQMIDKDSDEMNMAILSNITKGAGYFYNTSRYDLSTLLDDHDFIKENFLSYLEAFSPVIQDILKGFDFAKQVEVLDANDRLYSVIQAFANLDLDPAHVDTVRMGVYF